AYASVIAEREGLPLDDPRVRIWAAALRSVSEWAFGRWMLIGGSRTRILAEAWNVLAQLNDPVRPSRPARVLSSHRDAL
ncbi:MAG: hypothetical protein ACHQDE_01965, partial [Acidimicrobiia bacterium]